MEQHFNRSEELESKKLDVLNNKSFDEFQFKTTLNENQLYWLKYIAFSMENRRIAEKLYNIGYSLEEIRNLLQIPDEEASLIIQYLDKLGTIDIDYIVNKLSDHCREKTIVAVTRRMIDKDLKVDDIVTVASLIKKYD